MDAILIRDLRVEALIGIHKRERHVAQTVSIDLDIGLPGDKVFESDQVADTIDYEQVALRIRALAGSGHFRLVETLAERIARLLLDDFATLTLTHGAPKSPTISCAMRSAKVSTRRKCPLAASALILSATCS